MTDAVALQSFSMQAGQDVNLNFTTTDRNGDAQDITGASIRFVMSRRSNSAAVIDSQASPATATVTITTAASGLFTVALADTDTDALSGDYYYEAKLTDASSNESVVARGYVSILPSNTSG